MKTSYEDFLKGVAPFPQANFEQREGRLFFHGIDLMDRVKRCGTPFKLTFLPHIGRQITRAKALFQKAIEQQEYKGKYYYCYCTKSNFFFPVLEEVLRHDVGLETSSVLDISLLFELHDKGLLPLNRPLVHNGYKTNDYLTNVIDLHERGFENYLILDSFSELDRFLALLPEAVSRPVRVGLRMATYVQPDSPYYSSRLGMAPEELLALYEARLKGEGRVSLEMLHFFVDSGIRDDLHYWEEFYKALDLYVKLSERCSSMRAFNIGGGFPIQHRLDFSYDFRQMVGKILQAVASTCRHAGVKEPDIYTEFGSYTVGESGAVVFRVLEHKCQHEGENWYILDGSLLNTLPDIALQEQEFVVLPLNHWNRPPLRVQLGGLSCDQADFYRGSGTGQTLYLPDLPKGKEEPLYIAFLHTAAYQDALAGYGGVQHCLLPSPRQIFIKGNREGGFVETVLEEESGWRFLGID